jgi:hypothetical protein
MSDFFFRSDKYLGSLGFYVWALFKIHKEQYFECTRLVALTIKHSFLWYNAVQSGRNLPISLCFKKPCSLHLLPWNLFSYLPVGTASHSRKPELMWVYVYVCMPWIQISDKMTVEYWICHKHTIIKSMQSMYNYNSEKYDKHLYMVLWVTFTHNKTNLQSKWVCI